MRKLATAVARVVLNHPLIGSSLIRMKRIEGNTDTMATDGASLWYNPAFVETLSNPELDFVLIHEIFHKWFLHHLRREGRDFERWNIACDHAVNLSISENFPSLQAPKGVLRDFRYHNMSAEEIYRRLPQSDSDSKSVSIGEIRDGKQSESQVKAEIAEGLASVRPGSLPGSLEKTLRKFLEPSKIPWQEVLRDFISGCSKTDYSWKRPNRRFLPEYLPSLSEPGIGEIVVAIDTSGSCLEELPLFLTELESIASDSKPKKLTILLCDTAVTAVYLSFDEIPENFVNVGGGTLFTPVFQWIEENEVPDCLIYFTDGYGDIPIEPGYPVLWVITKTGRNSIKWGKEITL